MITVKNKGSFKRSEDFLIRLFKFDIYGLLNKYGKKGVEALSNATPKDSGRTAGSWYYDISKTGNGYVINWSNSSQNDGVNIALILQYGHGTGTGGYVQGTDYINPAIADIFERMANEAWLEITK